MESTLAFPAVTVNQIGPLARHDRSLDDSVAVPVLVSISLVLQECSPSAVSRSQIIAFPPEGTHVAVNPDALTVSP